MVQYGDSKNANPHEVVVISQLTTRQAAATTRPRHGRRTTLGSCTGIYTRPTPMNWGTGLDTARNNLLIIY